MIDWPNTALVEGLESRVFLSAAHQAGGAVRGMVFSDGDRNGVRSRGETGLPGITVVLDADASGTRNANEPATITGRTGGGRRASAGRRPTPPDTTPLPAYSLATTRSSSA